IADLPPIDFVVISHNHYDHLDIGTLKTLAERSPATRFFVGLGNDELLRNHGIENVTAFDWGQSTTVGPLRIYCLPSQHWSKRTLNDTRQTLWAAWAVQSANRKFYFGGDTGYFMGFARIGERFGHFDLAAVPIGAYQPVAMMRASHLNPEEAVVAATDLRARTMIAMHFGTFDLSDEPLDEPPTRFLNAARKSGVPADRAWVFKIGETRDF
ncbi:MAG: MBL fold metallo-hydrolase, partial [Pseudomonadota bacterium]